MKDSGKKEHKMNRSERIQIKAFICILGLLLLFFLLGGNLWIHLHQPKSQEETPLPVPEPVMEYLHNVWILEVKETELWVYRDGREERYEYGETQTQQEAQSEAETQVSMYQPDRSVREQVADVELTDGRVTDIRAKTQKIHGAILGADEDAVEVDGYGVLRLAKDYKGYRIYNTISMCTGQDLTFGYDFADLVLENGEICAILLVREEAMDSLRVLIKTSGFGSNLHQELTVSSDTDFVIRYGDYENRTEEWHEAKDQVVIAKDSIYFNGGRVLVEPQVLSGKILLENVSRDQGIPAYRGYLELFGDQDGFAVVNVVPLEEYLYSVVPSEMPASYPREALKAQAICARTYAYGHIQKAAYPHYGAHVDDSTSYQVYNNIAEQESTTTAVKETYGQLLYTSEGDVAGAYYYSTSCGVGSDAHVWKTQETETIRYLKAQAINPSALQKTQDVGIGEYLQDEEHFAEFIGSSDPEDYEYGESWYRWTYQVKELDPEQICERLKKRRQAKEELVLTEKDGDYVCGKIEDFSQIYNISITSRLPGGVADELVLETDSGTYKVISEHNIRSVLCDGKTKVKRKNGSEVGMPYLLPSGFFVIETGKRNGNVIGYTLTGGGFGHGVGMSQNAAKSMAGKGMSCGEILLFFYDGCVLRQMYD